MANQKRQISLFVNGQEVEATAKNIADAYRKASNELKRMVIGSDEYIAKLEEVKDLDGKLRAHRENLKGVEKGYSLMGLGLEKFAGVAAGAFAVDTIIQYGRQLFNTAAQMEAMQKKAQVVFGDALPRITAEAERNARAMGLTNSQYVAAAANIQDLLVPMGFQRDTAADISAQLVNLSGALSEWTGGQRSAQDVTQILSDALLGEREQLKGLGIDLQQADIDARLAAQGLEKLTGESRRQAEASATLQLILEKSADAQTAYAQGSESLVRQQAETSANITEITEKISTLLIPVFAGLATAAGAAVDVLVDVVDSIENMVNPAQAASDAFDEQGRKVSDLEKNVLPLIDRYETLTGKTTLNATEQEELRGVIDQIAQAIPGAVSQFDAYGVALGINADKARELIEVERARLQFINQEAINETQRLIDNIDEQIKLIQDRIARGRETFQQKVGDDFITRTRQFTNEEILRFGEEIKRLQTQRVGPQAEIARLSGQNIQAPQAAPNAGGGDGGGGNSEAAAQKLQDRLTDLIRRQLELRRELQALAQQDELAVTIAGIEKKYDVEIEKARELEARNVREATAQRIALEELKRQEIELATEENNAKRAEENAKLVEEARTRAFELAQAEAQAQQEAQAFLDQRQQEREAAEEELQQFRREALLSEREQEALELEQHYLRLLQLADEYGISTVDLQEAYAQKRQEIDDKYAKKSAEELYKANQARLAALTAEFTAFGDIIQATAQLLVDESESASALAKIATLAKIAFDTAAAISSLVAASEANPANAVTFGAAGIAQYAAGIIRILTNIAQAKRILTGAPEVTQRATGGYLDVVGADDGRTYRAQAIPYPTTGLLPGMPVTFSSNATGLPVLASERGAEYFVASEDLRNPYVANLVRMIDNITQTNQAPARQFADGGYTASTAAAAGAAIPAGIDAATIAALNNAIAQLTAVLAGGIVAVLPDRTIVKAKERFDIINGVSGGFYS